VVHWDMNPLKKGLMTLNRTAMGKDGKTMTWPEVVGQCTGPYGLIGADLVVKNTTFMGITNNEGIMGQIAAGKLTPPHPSYGACVTEIEMDVLTGEHVIIRSDLLYQQPRSVNPVIDLGQIQGAFVMGLGFFLKEFTQYSEDGTELITKDTWEYKPPCAQDIPQEFNVAYFREGSQSGLVYGAKGLGEPPLFMAVAAVSAVRECIMSARADAGQDAGDTFAHLDLPATPAACSTACSIDPLKLGRTTTEAYAFDRSDPELLKAAPKPKGWSRMCC